MFKPLGSLLPGALGRMHIRKPVEAAVVCRACDTALGELWDHAVPMRAVSYRDGSVTVAVTSSAWSHEVTQKGESLKERANKKLGSAAVSRVRTKVAPSAARGEIT